MKIRTSFVTNSSSASYVILKKGLTKIQIDLLLDPSILRNKMPSMFQYDGPDSWTKKDNGRSISISTSMDNFDYRDVFDFLNIPDANINGDSDD